MLQQINQQTYSRKKIVCHVDLILVLVHFVAWNQSLLSYVNVWSCACKVQVGFKVRKIRTPIAMHTSVKRRPRVFAQSMSVK